MLNFLTNSKEYEIQANGQLTSILSQFDSDYIMHIIADTIENQFNNFDIIQKPNVVQSFENVFKELYAMYEVDRDNITEVRVDAYQAIIHILKHKFGFEFVEQENTDWYTITYYLYDFFVSRFNYYMANFYSKYIYDERDNIYMNLHLEEFKKQKDTSSIYGRYAFSDSDSLGIIVANLPYVLKQLTSLPVPNDLVYRYAYGNIQETIDLFNSHIVTNGSLFQLYNSILFNEYMYPHVIPQIRLKIQMDNQEIFNAMKSSQMKKIEE